MHRITVLVFGLALICGCNYNSPALSTAEQLPGGAATVPTSGIDLSSIDRKVRPQDDFFAYVNGAWLANTPIPDDKSSWGSFGILREQSLQQLRDIILESSILVSRDPLTDKVGLFYRAFMDEERVNQLETDPLKNDLEAIARLSSHDEVAAYFGSSNRIGVDSPLNLYINQDDKDSTRYVIFLVQSGLGLLDRDYYFDSSERGQELRDAYLDYIATILELGGFSATTERAQRIMALETRLAEHHWTRVENRDADKTYNKYTRNELLQLLPDYNLEDFFAGIGIAAYETPGEDSKIPPDLIVNQPSYLEALNDIFRQTDLPTWHDYLRFNLLRSYAPFLSQPFVDANFNFYNKTLFGQPEQAPRWKRAVDSIDENMGELLGRLYVARHFPPRAKQRMTELVDNLIAAYDESINSLDWMGEETRRKALEKLAKFTPKIGYPDKWRDYSGLEIRPGDLVGNIRRARNFTHEYQIGKLGKPIDKTEWAMTPQTVNAYYNPGLNEIVFPAAILQPPFFNLVADDAVNYGAIGAIIGHEIGHGFDDQGSKYTGDGNLESWWTEGDRKRFEERTERLVAQYDDYEVLPGLKINGKLTLGENIGDLGGLGIALKAYQRSLRGKPAPVIDGFTGIQRVFIGWAQAWRVKQRQSLTEQLVKIDPHSPPLYRVNGVMRNIDEFYRAFDVQPGDELYLPPEQRVTIWQ